MNERIRLINLTRKLMVELGVGTYFPLVQYRIDQLDEEKIRRAYRIIREEVKTWP